MRPRLHRRTFLKLSAALGAAAYPLGSAQDALKSAEGPAIASTFPLPFPHRYFPNAEALLSRRLSAFDLLLVPAYAAAELIRRDALETIEGLPGRAHDPDGAYTMPHLTAVSAILYRDAQPRSLDDLWNAETLWPDSSRLVIGMELLRRGYPLNDTHSGHLAQIENDLAALRPRLLPDPEAGFRSGRGVFALAPIPVGVDEANPDADAPPPVRFATRAAAVGVMLPPEGAALIEYDWVIPRGAPNLEFGPTFIANTEYAILSTQYASPPTPPVLFPTPDAPRLTPLTPLLASALAQRAEIWSRVKSLNS